MRTRSMSSLTSSGSMDITSLTNWDLHLGSFSPTDTRRHFPSSPVSPSISRSRGFLLGSQKSSSRESLTNSHLVPGNISRASSSVLLDAHSRRSALDMPSLQDFRSLDFADDGKRSPRGTGTSPASIALGR